MTVYLVGAGPGDPGLLTVRGAELLGRAEVVIYDRLVEPSLLKMAPPGALRVDVGKRPGGPLQQDKINELLVGYGADPAAVVVRLKGGDPFVFGRGGEEAQALIDAGVRFEVVPGVSSAVAVPAYAGIPVTHRGLSTSFMVVTGHSRHASDRELDWDAVARTAGTIVVLMGVAHRAEIAERLLGAGRSPSTPVAAIRWGTRPEQQTLRTTLGELGGVTLEPPVTLVIGEVAGMDLGWYERRPLFGRRVVVTRARDQASELVERLRMLGATTVELPVIEIAPPADGGARLRQAAASLGEYAWVVFASANAVRSLCASLRDARAFGSARVAAVGPGTADALATFGVVADLVPDQAVAEALVVAMGPAPTPPGRVLIPRAAVGRDVLPDGLRRTGWEVEVVEAYRTVPVLLDPEQVAETATADALTFTSSSTVTNFVAAAGTAALARVVACIGPVTADTARAAGLRVDVVADPHTIDGLLDALVGALARSGD